MSTASPKGAIPPKISDNYNGDFNVIKQNSNQCIDAVNLLITDAAMLVCRLKGSSAEVLSAFKKKLIKPGPGISFKMLSTQAVLADFFSKIAGFIPAALEPIMAILINVTASVLYCHRFRMFVQSNSVYLYMSNVDCTA